MIGSAHARGGLAALAILLAGAASCRELPALPEAEVYVLGELHDNPDHHRAQAAMIAAIGPAAVAFEMLAPVQAARIGPDTPRDETLGALLAWERSGWPDFAIYLPVFQAFDAPVVGAGGTDARDLSAYGLDEALPAAEQAEREALQAAAHCDALPADLLPSFVARQREVDARLAHATLAALDRHGPPVVLIAGNGHARTDWGVPAAIARVRPEVRVVSVIQGEGGAVPPGDVTLTAAAPERGDPCAAFR